METVAKTEPEQVEVGAHLSLLGVSEFFSVWSFLIIIVVRTCNISKLTVSL